MRPNAQELLRGVKMTLNEVVLPVLPDDPFVHARMGMVINILDMLSAQWDMEAQLLIDERNSVTRHFREAAEALRRLNGAEAKGDLAELAAALEQAVAGQDETDFRLSALEERNNQLKALLIRLMEVCDRAINTPSWKPLLPVREAILRDVRAQVAARAFPYR